MDLFHLQFIMSFFMNDENSNCEPKILLFSYKDNENIKKAIKIEVHSSLSRQKLDNSSKFGVLCIKNPENCKREIGNIEYTPIAQVNVKKIEITRKKTEENKIYPKNSNPISINHTKSEIKAHEINISKTDLPITQEKESNVRKIWIKVSNAIEKVELLEIYILIGSNSYKCINVQSKNIDGYKLLENNSGYEYLKCLFQGKEFRICKNDIIFPASSK